MCCSNVYPSLLHANLQHIYKYPILRRRAGAHLWNHKKTSQLTPNTSTNLNINIKTSPVTSETSKNATNMNHNLLNEKSRRFKSRRSLRWWQSRLMAGAIKTIQGEAFLFDARCSPFSRFNRRRDNKEIVTEGSRTTTNTSYLLHFFGFLHTNLGWHVYRQPATSSSGIAQLGKGTRVRPRKRSSKGALHVCGVLVKSARIFQNFQTS